MPNQMIPTPQPTTVASEDMKSLSSDEDDDTIPPIKNAFTFENNVLNMRPIRDYVTMGISLGQGKTSQVKKCEFRGRSSHSTSLCVKIVNRTETASYPHDFSEEGFHEV
jgi:hypothetical protein